MKDPEAAAARAEHRVGLGQAVDLVERALEVLEVGCALDAGALHFLRNLFEAGKELVERRVEQADRDGQAGHLLEQPLEVLLLERPQLAERLAAVALGVGHDHRAHLRHAVLGHEHVLGAAEADALRAELARLARVVRIVGVRAHAEPA